MEYRFKISLLFLLCLFGIQTYAQIQQKAGINKFQETIWISSDKHLYLPGESVSIHVTLLEKDNYQKSVLSKFVRIELLNSSGNPLNQSNLELIDAELHHTLHLPPDAKTGWYYIRAYTNWMRNFSDDQFPVLAIKVVDPQDDNLTSMMISPNTFKAKLYSLNGKTGLFVGHDEYSGAETAGILMTSAGDTLIEFTTHLSGWTSFPLTLNPSDQCKIILENHDNVEIQVDIADINNEAVQIIEDDKYIFISYPSDPEGKKLIIKQAYTLLWSAESRINETEWRISKSGLPTGIIQIRITNNDQETIAYQLWSQSRINNFKLNTIQADILGHRQVVDIELNLQIESADLSILIQRNEPFEYLTKYFPGLPGWKSTSSIPNNKTAFDGWLIAQTFISRQKEHTQENDTRYMPEIRAGIIEGRIVNQITGQAVENAGVCINILNDNSFEEVETDSSGYFYFSLEGQTGSTDYLLNQTVELNHDNQIEAFPTYSSTSIALRTAFSLDEDEIEYLKQQNILLQLQKVYASEKNVEIIKETKSSKATFFHPPDFTIIVDNYVKLANVREIIYEVVPNVVVRKRNGKDYLKVYNDQAFAAGFETLVLLDGIPLKDQESVLKLSPDRIEKIEVKNRIYIHGRSIYSAIVNFISPNRDYAGLDLPEKSILSSIKLPLNNSSDKQQSASGPSSMASLSETLEWTTLSYSKKCSISFQTNDLSGNYTLFIYGYDDQGNWIYTENKFRVRN